MNVIKKKGILDILTIVIFLLVVSSCLLPIKQEGKAFSNTNLYKVDKIGPLGSKRCIAFEYNAKEDKICSFTIPLEQTGKNKNNGKILCNIYEEGKLKETHEYKYADIRKTMINKKMNLNIILDNTVTNNVRVELYGIEVKTRIYLKGTDQIYTDFSSYLGKNKLEGNIICDVNTEEKKHPYTWELCVIFTIVLMCNVIMKEKTNEKKCIF